MRRRVALLMAAALAAVSAIVLAATLTSAPRAQASTPSIGHVFVIVLENESESATFGSSSPAPYLAKTLVSQGAFVPNYYGIGHSSLDNYIAMVSGQAPDPSTRADCGTYTDFTTTGPTTSDGQAVGDGCVYPSSVLTVADQLQTAGLTWKGYMDSMGADLARDGSATCSHPTLGAADGTQAETPTDQYATRHDPFMYFHSVIDNAATCNADVVALAPNLANDLASVATTPNLSFITPGLCNDGHNAPCQNGNAGGLAQVNTYLQTLIPEIEGSPAYKKDGLIAIVFDEAAGSDTSSCCGEQSGPNVTQPGGSGPGGGQTGAVLLSPFINGGTVTQTAYNHYSLLRYIEQTFGLSYLGYAGQSGLSTFGSDVFGVTTTSTSSSSSSSSRSSSSSSSSTSSSTSTSSTLTPTAYLPVAPYKPPVCTAATSGAVIGAVSVTKTRTGRVLTFQARRAGALTFQVRPAHGHARPQRREKLTACEAFSLRLPAGHGAVHLRATAGRHRESQSVTY